ncbi:hypothetical protein T484DRAFT_1983121 [Baffinella frigidus]|nr:hypothetical protein T484DRAFT_1983121 [Cryptophyta sp. CCMP2293]
MRTRRRPRSARQLRGVDSPGMRPGSSPPLPSLPPPAHFHNQARAKHRHLLRRLRSVLLLPGLFTRRVCLPSRDPPDGAPDPRWRLAPGCLTFVRRFLLCHGLHPPHEACGGLPDLCIGFPEGCFQLPKRRGLLSPSLGGLDLDRPGVRLAMSRPPLLPPPLAQVRNRPRPSYDQFRRRLRSALQIWEWGALCRKVPPAVGCSRERRLLLWGLRIVLLSPGLSTRRVRRSSRDPPARRSIRA